MLNIVQQLFLNEADLTENHLIQSWLKKMAKYASTNTFIIPNCIFDMKYHYLIVEILSSMKYFKFVENFGKKNYARP